MKENKLATTNKGGHNDPPTTPRPEAPRGQGNKSPMQVNVKTEGQPFEEKMEFYKICVECRNCGRPNYLTDEAYIVAIPHGLEVSKVLMEMSCKYCKCKTLRRVHK